MEPTAPATPEPAASAAPSAAPVVPSGPITLARVREAWPEILARLEDVSRTSWMLATSATALAYADDVLTLGFPHPSDVAAFKKLAAGKGPSEDLRGAIAAVLGVRVKYVARLDTPPGGHTGHGDAGPGPSGPGPSEPGPSGAGPSSAPANHRPSSAGGPAGGGAPSGHGTTPAAPPRPASAAAAPVTEWAVAPIPSGDAPAPAPQFAVDEEPEEAVAVPARTLTIQRDGEVIPDSDIPPDEDDAPPPPDDEAPVPPRAPVAVERPTDARPDAPRSASSRPAAARTNHIERVGEAVVRQVLGATFVREEPHTAPTRFS